jgi:hypothetical protein
LPSTTTEAPRGPAPVVVVTSSAGSPAPAAPLDGEPRLVVQNDETIDIDLYGVYLVDERGERGTVTMWPRPAECPSYEPRKHIVPKGSTLALAPPTSGYDPEKCAPGPALPPGRYVVRVDSGYAEDFYASAVIELPLAKPVLLRLVNHGDDKTTCDEATARRAARMVFAGVGAMPGLPAGLLKGCDADGAVCGSLPLPDSAPPATCTVTWREKLLVIDRPAGDDTIRRITAWTDRPVVYARAPEVDRTSASRIDVGGKEVVLEGITGHHSHMHGGDASTIGRMEVRVHNPLSRALSVQVDAVEWLVDFSCGLPTAVKTKPKVAGATPATLPPGESTLEIAFAPMSAYQAHCDRFASRVKLRVEGQAIAVTVEHEVTRYEPLRH